MDELHVFEGHELVRELQNGKGRLPIGANELRADDFAGGRPHADEREFDVPLGAEALGQALEVIFIAIRQRRLIAGGDKDDLAFGLLIGKGLGQQAFAPYGGHAVGQVGQIAVVGDAIPTGGHKMRPNAQRNPDRDHGDPMTGDKLAKTCEHAWVGGKRRARNSHGLPALLARARAHPPPTNHSASSYPPDPNRPIRKQQPLDIRVNQILEQFLAAAGVGRGFAFCQHVL